MPDSKKKEMATYSKLGLYRTVKSKRRRSFEEDKGLYLFVGDNRSGRPWIKVLKGHYEKAWEVVMAKTKARPRPKEMEEGAWLDLLRLQMEHEIYELLLTQTTDLEQLSESFQKQHGRKMTAYEKERFGAAMNHDTKLESNPKTETRQADRLRQHWVNNVVSKIRKTQDQRPARLQQAWASVVGTEAAMETNLEGIDSIRGTAYCRCLSSVRRFELARQSDLPKRLGLALNQTINKIVYK